MRGAVCLFALLCVHVYIPAHMSACMRVCGMQHKVLACVPVDTKPAPIPLFLFPGGGEIRQSDYLPAHSRGVGAVGWRLEVVEVVVWGQSSHIYKLGVSFGEGNSHFWHSYAYLASAWPAATIFTKSQKRNDTQTQFTHELSSAVNNRVQFYICHCKQN